MPFKNPEDRRAYMRTYNAAHPDRSRGNRNAARDHARTFRRFDAPFAGVDGEGANLPLDGALFGESHEYLSLRAGNHLIYHDGAPLHARELLAFLSDLPTDRIYVSYYFDYDVTMILRELRPDRIRKILRSGFAPTTIDEKYDVRYIPHKEFAVKRHDQDRYTVINDVGTFFQAPFCKLSDISDPASPLTGTLETWQIGTPEQRRAIAVDKARRGSFEGIGTAELEYNKLECRLLEQLMEEYREVCTQAGYIPYKWQGPGNLATTILRTHGVPPQRDIPACSNQRLMDLANEAYYGGRFERRYAGLVPGPVYEHDISSAYPDAMRKLPCLLHGSWDKRAPGKVTPGSLWFGRVDFSHHPEALLGNLPIRTKDGGLCFPLQGKGVYWNAEIEAATAAGTQITIGTAYEYRPGSTCDCTPFSFIEDLYRERKRIGKTGKGKVLKLGLNSLYGKMAQSIGQPAYANPLYAGLITALTRAKIIEAYKGRESDVIQIATDAVYVSGRPLHVHESSDLGAWETIEFPEGLFIVQPGVYYDLTDGAPQPENRTRGVSAHTFKNLHQELVRAFRLDPLNAKIDIKAHTFIGLALASQWNRWETAGQWLDLPRKISFDWSAKNDPRRWYQTGPDTVELRPLLGSPHLQSTPYRKNIGGTRDAAQEREMRYSQPDFAEWFQAG